MEHTRPACRHLQQRPQVNRFLRHSIAPVAVTVALACANPLEPAARDVRSEPWVQTIPNATNRERRLQDLEDRLGHLTPALHNGVLECISGVALLPATPDGLRHFNAQVLGCGESLSEREGGGYSYSISALGIGAQLVLSSRVFEAGDAIRQTGDVSAGIELLGVVDSLLFVKNERLIAWRAEAGLGELHMDVYRAMKADEGE